MTSPHRRKSIFDLSTFRVSNSRPAIATKSPTNGGGIQRRKSLKGLLHATVRGVRHMLLPEVLSTQETPPPDTPKNIPRSKSVGYSGELPNVPQLDRN